MNRSMLVRSILKSNLLFSFALVIIYTLTMALMVMLCFFSESIDATFQNFLDGYGLPDAYIITEGSTEMLISELSSVPGVSSVSGGLVVDIQTELSSGKILSLRYIGLNIYWDSEIGLYNVSSRQCVRVNDSTVAVSSAFARNNNIAVGDILTLSDGTMLSVSDIVSSPETISAARDGSSWYDEQDFAFIYLPNSRLQSITGLYGTVNQWRIYLEEGADSEKALSSLVSIPGMEIISAELFEGSAVDRQISAGIDGTKALVTYLPGVICLISILFSTLFMRQIIHSSGRNIALLRTFGYSSSGISCIFIRYNLLLTTSASFFGGILGGLLLREMLNIYRSVFDIPLLKFSGNEWLLFAVFAAVQLIGITSCLLTVSGISRIDPVTVFTQENGLSPAGTPKWLVRSRLDSFSKISVAAMYRSRGRLILSALCCTACLCLNFLVISILISKNTGIKYLFNERLKYDAMVYCDGEASVEGICSLPSVDSADKRVSFSVIYDNEAMRIEALGSDDTLTDVMDTDYAKVVPEEYGILIEEGFARRHNISAGDTILIEGVAIEVTCLTREYLYPVMYISAAQAAILGYTQNNCVAITLKDGYTMTDFSREAVTIPGYRYFTDTASREKCARQTLKQLDIPCLLFLVFALVIGLVIISNMNLISIKERSREYATLTMLGTEQIRFFKMSSIDSLVQFVLACIAGIPVSIPLSRFVMTGISSVSQEYPPEKSAIVALIASCLILLYVFIGEIITLCFIRNIDTLKTLGQRE